MIIRIIISSNTMIISNIQVAEVKARQMKYAFYFIVYESQIKMSAGDNTAVVEKCYGGPNKLYSLAVFCQSSAGLETCNCIAMLPANQLHDCSLNQRQE